MKREKALSMHISNERLLYEILNDAYPHQWVGEHAGIEGRKYRFDCCTIENNKFGRKIAVEIDGGMYPFFIKTKDGRTIKVIRGGHSSPEGITRDMDKSNAAQIDGWVLLRYTPETLKKTPWKIIKDIRTLCGASADDKQTLLCFDQASTGKMQMQVKLGFE